MTFDQTLYPGALNGANWVVRRQPSWYTGGFTSVIGGIVQIRTVLRGPYSGPNNVDYDPPPFDVRNHDLVPAAAFYGWTLV